jgi:hypothetical protein
LKSRCVGRDVSAKAARQAWRNKRGRSDVDSTGLENFVTAAKSGACGISWYALRCWKDGSLRPLMAITGLRPSHASCRPEARLAAPTDCAMHTPGRPATRA